jgi:hypothetical protein
MTNAYLAPLLKTSFLNNNGQPLVGGLLYSYAAGTTTPIATYTDNTGATANANPITLDYRGSCNVWLTPNVAYKFTLTDSLGNLIFTEDQVVAQPFLTLFAGVDTGAANAYVVNFAANFSSYANGIVLYFIPSFANTGPSTINVNSLGVVSIVNPSGTALGANQIVANQVTELLYYNGVFQLVGGSSTGANTGTFGTEYPIAAAATVDLGTAPAHNVQIIGAAAITSLGTSAQLVAPIFVVRMSGVCTLTQSSALILPGGTNIVTTAGDAFVAEYMGSGNWRVLIYQYASGIANVRVKSADTAITSSTTLTQDPDLITNSLGAGKYQFEIYLDFDSVTAAAGFKWQASGTVADSRGVLPALAYGQVNGAAYGPKADSFYSSPISYATVTNSANGNQVMYKGSLLVSTPGTFGIQWAQNTSNASATTLRAGSYLNVTLIGTGASAAPTTHIYTSGSGTETIPTGYTTATVEVWGGGGGGGLKYSTSGAGGGGGGSGGYARTVISVAGLGGQTMNYSVGTGGSVGFNGNASTVTSGTFSIASMTGGGGTYGASATGLGLPGAGGAGGVASGGVTVNTTGNSGSTGLPSSGGGTGGAGGAGIAGVNYGGMSGGSGSGTIPVNASAGGNGAISFSYS